MPLKGFRCPVGGEAPGRDNKIQYCINKCTKPCVAPHVLAGMLAEEKHNPHKGKLISVTMLTGGCKRKTSLERNVDYYIEPDKKLPTFRGTLVHSLVELGKTRDIKKAGWLIEHHMELPVRTPSGEWTLSGTVDSVDVPHKTIFDVKTLQEYAVTLLVTGQEHGTWSDHISDSYVKQLNIYRYMGKKLGHFEADRLRLQIMAFGRLILTGTVVTYKVKTGKWYEPAEFYVPDVPVLEDTLVESWIHTEGDDWYKILFDDVKAPVCTKEWAWLCKSCVFNGTTHCPDPEFERELL